MSQKVVAVYDISSSAVAGAHTVVVHPSEVSILAHSRIAAPVQEERNIDRFIEATIEHLTQVVAQVRATDVHHPAYVQVLLASPWYVAHVRTVTYTQAKPFVCTHALIEKIVADEITHTLTEEHTAAHSFGSDSLVVERKITAIKLNGYPTEDPFSKRASSLEIQLTVSLGPKQVIERFTDVLRRAYGTRPVVFATEISATSTVYRDLYPQTTDALFIDIGEEITDVAFMKGNALVHQYSFPTGTYALTRILAKDHTIPEAVALLEAYRLGKLAASATGSLDRALKAFTTQWQEGFQKMLAQGQYGFCAPSHIVVSVDPRFKDIVRMTLASDEYLKHHCSAAKTEILTLDMDTLNQYVHVADQSVVDISLAVGSMYAAKTL